MLTPEQIEALVEAVKPKNEALFDKLAAAYDEYVALELDGAPERKIKAAFNRWQRYLAAYEAIA